MQYLVFLKVDEIEYHAVIEFFVKDVLTLHEIHSKLIKVYGNSPLLSFNDWKWAAEFKHGHTRLEDGLHEGCTKSAITEISEKIHDIILDDWQFKVYVKLPSL